MTPYISQNKQNKNKKAHIKEKDFKNKCLDVPWVIEFFPKHFLQCSSMSPLYTSKIIGNKVCNLW